MKLILPTLAIISLTACATNSSNINTELPKVEISQAIKAFKDICLKTAPSFLNAAREAAAYGIIEIMDAGYKKSGFNIDQSIGLQIKNNNECVITTPSQVSHALTKQFLQTVSHASGAPISQNVPTKATIQKVNFIFHHDRKGGEAFVMLKADSN